MRQCLLLIACYLYTIGAFAQYTETINSNRPGASQGAFTVGNGVIQVETGFSFDDEKHTLRRTETSITGLDYQLRYGFFMEKLELTLEGSFKNQTTDFIRGGSTESVGFTNFQSNVLAGKYLLYDPYLKREQEEKSYISWNANNRLQWRDLIPAISIYAGFNFAFGENPFLYTDEPTFSPKIGLITQNNYGRWVLVTNFYADKAGTDFSNYTGIVSVTHSASSKIALFGEFQTYIGDYYSDEVVRGGLAYLFTKDIQFDIQGLLNFKDTPQKYGFSIGISYRYDKFRKEERIYEDGPLDESGKSKTKDNFKLEDDK